MEIDKLFSSLKEKIPFQFDNKIPFHQNLNKEFADYFEYLNTVDKNEFAEKFCNYEKNITLKKFITIEKNICKGIKRIIFNVKNGDSFTAYKILHSLLNNKIDNLSDKLYNYFSVDFSNEQKCLYRIRYVITKEYTFPNSMKHCPFEATHCIGNYRFSLSGFPCLYLGSSIRVCEAEIPKQEGKDYHKAQFAVKDVDNKTNGNSLKLLFLNLVPPIDSSDNNELFNFLLLYPFYVACLTKRKNEKGSFHAEYIIPQLLLLFVRKEELLNGIRYLSTYYSIEKNDYKEMINYVFPVKQIEDKGFDEELMNRFEIKEI